MYAYVDETGNTGKDIFNIEQPLFITAALVTKTNFDVLYKQDIKVIKQGKPSAMPGDSQRFDL